MPPQKIIVIGSANVDFVMCLERLPALGETATNGQFTQTYGGKGANQAVAAARAGGQVTFLGCVGNDAYGRTILENLRRDKIDVSSIVVQTDVPTGSALVMFDRQGDNYLAVAPGANYALLPAHIDDWMAGIDGASMLVMQMEIPVEATQRILARAAERGVPVLFNFAPAHTQEIAIDARMTGLVVNETEAEALCGFPIRGPVEAEAAAETLRQRGPEFVIITLGAQGCVVRSAAVQATVPAFAVTPADSTAAGDVFCGVLALALVEKKPLREAVRFAAAAAALSVTRAGAQPSIPVRAEIKQFLEAHPK